MRSLGYRALLPACPLYAYLFIECMHGAELTEYLWSRVINDWRDQIIATFENKHKIELRVLFHVDESLDIVVVVVVVVFYTLYI